MYHFLIRMMDSLDKNILKFQYFMILYFTFILIMFGFQSLAKGAIRSAVRTSLNYFSTQKPLSQNWSLKQTTCMLNRCTPVPGSGLLILNLRQLLQKCRSQSETDMELSTNGTYISEQVLVLSKTSLIDNIGMIKTVQSESIISSD